MPIISLQNGHKIGRVRGVLVDPEKRAVVAFILDQKGWFRECKMVPFNKIQNIGKHAITVTQSSCVENLRNVPQLNKHIRKPTSIIGAEVITEDGTVLGTVIDYTFDTTTGSLASLEILGKLGNNIFRKYAALDASFIYTIGPKTIIVYTGSEEKLIESESSFQNPVKSIFDAGSQILNSATSKTKRVKKNIIPFTDRFIKKNNIEEKDGENNGKN